MLKNIYDPPRDSKSRLRQLRLTLHYPSPLPTANAAHVVYRVLPYASHPFRSPMKACWIQRVQVKLDIRR